MPKVQTRGVGSVAYRSDYSFPTSSSFVALNCLFSWTPCSFSILSNPSSLTKGRGIFQERAPPAPAQRHYSALVFPQTSNPQEATADEKKSLSALVCELLEINHLNFHCRATVARNSTFLESPTYWQVPGKLARNSNCNCCLS